MTAVDTSVCIPALLAWHEHHAASRRAAADAFVPSHALAETYSVLTRLPAPHRLDATTAATLLDGWFGTDRVLAAPVSLQRSLVRQIASHRIEGGAVYDALVGLIAKRHGQVLLTRDARASRTYGALGIDFHLVED